MAEANSNNSKWMPRKEYESQCSLISKNEKLYRDTHSQLHEATEKAMLAAAEVLNERLRHMNRFREETVADRAQYITRRELMAWALGILGILAGSLGAVVGLLG